MFTCLGGRVRPKGTMSPLLFVQVFIFIFVFAFVFIFVFAFVFVFIFVFAFVFVFPETSKRGRLTGPDRQQCLFVPSGDRFIIVFVFIFVFVFTGCFF